MPFKARVTFYQYAFTQLVLRLYFKAYGLTTLYKKRTTEVMCGWRGAGTIIWALKTVPGLM